MDNYKNPLPGYTYLSKSLEAFGEPGRKVRIATKAIDSTEQYAFAEVKGEVVLRHKEGGRNCITAKFFEDNRGVYVLSIQGYTAATQKPHNASFSFRGEEIGRLVEFINHIQSMPLNRDGGMRISDENFRRLVLSQMQARTLVQDNEELFAAVVRASLTKEDIVAVGYRKRQLAIFERLLEDPEYFEHCRVQKDTTREGLWQKFFEKNPWIFGYGLSYLYLSGLDGKKLEQVVSGYRVFTHGKRVDGLMRSHGVISSLCFVEIKTHETGLLGSRSYRSGCWAPSTELAGAVSQVQGTVASATAEIRKLVETTDDGDPVGQESFNHMPRSFLIVGHLKQFVNEHGVNEEKHRSFELFRGNTLMPEIVTFDELYERARFIVHQHEAAPAAVE